MAGAMVVELDQMGAAVATGADEVVELEKSWKLKR